MNMRGKHTMSKEIEVGKIYKTRDGRKALCYRKNSVFCNLACVIIGSGEFFDVDEKGSFYSSHESHNDLVEEIK